MMKVLILASANANNYISPFIIDQVEALKKEGIEIDYFYIKGKGILGYLKNYRPLLEKIKSFKPNLLHAHYGLSGLLSTMQRKVPVVITFHGCDINLRKNRFLSNIASKLSYKSIYVSDELASLSNQKNSVVIPCGVDMDIFYPIDKSEAKRQMNLDSSKKYILFSSSFDNEVKNYPLAKNALSIVNNTNLELLELKGYSRKEVAVLMNAVDLVLLTSFREGSPQFVKEALASNTPIVSVNVGDVEELLHDIEGTFLSLNVVENIAEDISKVLKQNKRTQSRKSIDRFDNKIIAKKIIAIYNECLGSKIK